MSKELKIDSRIAHSQAGLVAAFQWQDEANEGNLDADEIHVDHTTILGTLPEEVNGSPVYLVFVEGTAKSTFGYSYPIDTTLKVYVGPTKQDTDGLQPLVAEATEDEEKACEQHTRDLACKEYAELMKGIDTGAYSRSEDGAFWHESQNISRRIDELDATALEVGEHFAKQADGTYKLEPATQEEIDAYEKAKEEADEE